MLMSFDDSSSNPNRETKNHDPRKSPIPDRNTKTEIENQLLVQRSRASIRPQRSAETSSTSPTEDGLQFINLLGTTHHGVEGRNTVRSQARKHAWKTQKNQKKQVKRKDVLASPAVSQQDIATPILQKQSKYNPETLSYQPRHAYYERYADTREHYQRPHRYDSYSTLARRDRTSEHERRATDAVARLLQPQVARSQFKNGHSDPFNAFPVPINPRLHHLIHYSRGTRNVVPEDTQDTLSCHMGTNAALVYVTLAWTTALETSDGGARNPESEFYLQRSIIAVNEELSRIPQNGLSDGTIAAVACLTNMENLNGDKEKSRIHMSGLQQMIDIRGGMASLGMNGILRRLVLWADVFSATRWQSTPLFSINDFPDLLNLPPLDYFRPPGSPKPHFAVHNPEMLDLMEKTGNQDFFAVMRDTYELAHFLDNVPTKDPGLLERSAFSDRIYIAEHNLLWLIARNEGRQRRNSILLPLMHALLLYVYTNIRLTPVNGQIRLTLISRLQTYIQQSDVYALNDLFPHELRWAIFIGGAAASAATPERDFFVRTLVDIGCRKEWGSWDLILLGLKGFEAAFLKRCEEYFKEVDIMRGNDGHKDGRHGPHCIGEENYFIRLLVDD